MDQFKQLLKSRRMPLFQDYRFGRLHSTEKKSAEDGRRCAQINIVSRKERFIQVVVDATFLVQQELEQVDVSFSRVCSIIDHEFLHNIVKVAVDPQTTLTML